MRSGRWKKGPPGLQSCARVEDEDGAVHRLGGQVTLEGLVDRDAIPHEKTVQRHLSVELWNFRTIKTWSTFVYTSLIMILCYMDIPIWSKQPLWRWILLSKQSGVNKIDIRLTSFLWLQNDSNGHWLQESTAGGRRAVKSRGESAGDHQNSLQMMTKKYDKWMFIIVTLWYRILYGFWTCIIPKSWHFFWTCLNHSHFSLPLSTKHFALQATKMSHAKGHVGVIHEPNDLRTEELAVVLGIQIWPGALSGQRLGSGS